MERETREIETPIGKHKVVLKTYLTGREQRAIEAIYLGTVKYELETQTVRPSFTGTTAQEAENEAIRQQIVSVDGKADDVLNTVLDMHADDFQFVKEQLRIVSVGPDGKKKLPS